MIINPLENHHDKSKTEKSAPLNEELRDREKIANLAKFFYGENKLAKHCPDNIRVCVNDCSLCFADSILSLVGSRQEGRQEVVEWINKRAEDNPKYYSHIHIGKVELEAQLKEWGIKEGK